MWAEKMSESMSKYKFYITIYIPKSFYKCVCCQKVLFLKMRKLFKMQCQINFIICVPIPWPLCYMCILSCSESGTLLELKQKANTHTHPSHTHTNKNQKQNTWWVPVVYNKMYLSLMHVSKWYKKKAFNTVLRNDATMSYFSVPSYFSISETIQLLKFLILMTL